MTQKIIEKLIEEYNKKTYEELFALPLHFQLILPELEALNQTIEFLRIPDDNGALKIFFRQVYWKTPQEALTSYTHQYLLMGLTQKGAQRKAEKTIEKVRKEGVDLSGQGLPKSVVSAMKKMGEENPELAFPFLPPPYASELIFNYAIHSDGFVKTRDDTMIKNQEEVDTLFLQENDVIEQASWFGQTGLSEEVERELPKYLRLEFGEFFEDEGSLKASDLDYLGIFHKSDEHAQDRFFNQNVVSVDIWQIGTSQEYAYVEIFENGDYGMSMGDGLPQSAISF